MGDVALFDQAADASRGRALFVPFGQRLGQLVAVSPELLQSLIELRKLPARDPPHVGAGRSARLALLNDARDLLEREAHRLRLSDEVEARENRLGIEAVAGLGAPR